MNRYEWTEWRILAKRPGASRFVDWVSNIKSEPVAEARLAFYRRTTNEPGWDYKLQSRTVTQETTAWR